MSWIILIFAGLMEVGFTFCLGKTKTAAVSLLPVPTLIDRPTYSESSATTSADSICDTIKIAARPSMGHAAHYRIAVVSS